jgi:hypothetical protein
MEQGACDFVMPPFRAPDIHHVVVCALEEVQGRWSGLQWSPGLRQTVKTLLAVRWNCIVLRTGFPAKCAPTGEAEAGSAGEQPAKE